MDDYERNLLARAQKDTVDMRAELKREQQQKATAMNLVAAANTALEQAATDLEGRARSIRALIKQIGQATKRKTKTAKRR